MSRSAVALALWTSLGATLLASQAQARLGVVVDTSPVQEARRVEDADLKASSYQSCVKLLSERALEPPEVLRTIPLGLRPGASHQYCLLKAELEWFDRMSRARSPSLKEGCAARPEGIKAKLEFLGEASRLSEILRAKYPDLFPALQSADDADPVARLIARLPELASEARNAVANLEMIRRQCDYARRRTEGLRKGAPEAAALGEAGSAKDPAALLDRAYDNPGQGAGSAAVAFAGGGGAKPLPTPPSRARARRLDRGEVPHKSFESLTEGIRFQGDDKLERAVFQRALGHLYGAPSGQELLEEVQEMRGHLGADFQAQAEERRPRHEREMRALSERKARLPGTRGREWSDLDLEIRGLEKRLAHEGNFLRAAAHNPKPDILVSFGEGGRHASGHARTETRIESDSLVMSIEINKSRLEDGNPARAVDKVLGHELQHTADQWIFTFRSKKAVNLILGENRAYLKEAHLIMEQQGAMSQEPRSETVEGLRRSDVAKLLRDPLGARLDQISDPLYLWHLTQADLEGPEAGLKGRLAAAHRMHSSWDDERKWLIDPTDELTKARAQARTESGPYSLASWERRFVELGQSTEFAKGWLAIARDLANSLKNPGGKGADWKRAYHNAEENYYRDLLKFKSRYGEAR